MFYGLGFFVADVGDGRFFMAQKLGKFMDIHGESKMCG
jgi:hypothetical protein